MSGANNLGARHTTIRLGIGLLIIVAATLALTWEVEPGLIHHGRSRTASRSVIAPFSGSRVLLATASQQPPTAPFSFAVLPPVPHYCDALALTGELPALPTSVLHSLPGPAWPNRGPPTQA